MKTIVAATDFSSSSVNAVNYAADLAAMTGYSLSLLHVYSLPLAIGEALPLVSSQELYTEAEKQMNDLRSALAARSGGRLVVITAIRQGNIVDEIYSHCHSLNPWLLVMGPEKADAFERLLVGGITTDAVRKMQWPVLIVPMEARFHGICRIGLACDLEDVEHSLPVQAIERLTEELKAELYVLHVNATPAERFEDSVITQTELLRDILQSVKPKYKFINDNSIEKGLNEFATHHHIDLLIALPKKHGFFYRLFYGSQSKKMILHSYVPFVFIHE